MANYKSALFLSIGAGICFVFPLAWEWIRRCLRAISQTLVGEVLRLEVLFVEYIKIKIKIIVVLLIVIGFFSIFVFEIITPNSMENTMSVSNHPMMTPTPPTSPPTSRPTPPTASGSHSKSFKFKNYYFLDSYSCITKYASLLEEEVYTKKLKVSIVRYVNLLNPAKNNKYMDFVLTKEINLKIQKPDTETLFDLETKLLFLRKKEIINLCNDANELDSQKQRLLEDIYNRYIKIKTKERVDKNKKYSESIKKILSQKLSSNAIGWAKREVIFNPVLSSSELEEEISQALKDIDISYFNDLVENQESTTKIFVSLSNFPRNSFYDVINYLDNPEHDKLGGNEIIKWTVNNPKEPVKFAYIVPPYNQFKKLISLLSSLDVIENWVFVIIGGAILFVLSKIVKFFIEVVKSMSEGRNINIQGGSYYESIDTGGGNYIQGDYYEMSQDLSEAASQIQDLIEQLSSRGITLNDAQRQVAEDIANQSENDPTLKEKLIKWGQSLGDATVTDVVKATVKMAIRSAGIPLP